MASTIAEELSLIDGKEVKVIGWYHSHPHITVVPSHVDCRTQALYQSLDARFIGLIFSAFSCGRLEICGFQSKNTGTPSKPSWQRSEIPVSIGISNGVNGEERHDSSVSPGVSSSSRFIEHAVNLQAVLLSEEKLAREDFYSQHVSDSGLSSMGVLQSCAVYQSSLLRIVDSQLLPLLSVATSRKESLEAEKIKLLAQLAHLQRSASSVDTATPDPQVRTQRGVAFDAAVSALGQSASMWIQSCSAVHSLSKGIDVKCSLTPGTVNPFRAPIDDCKAIRIRPAPRTFELGSEPSTWVVDMLWEDWHSYILRDLIPLPVTSEVWFQLCVSIGGVAVSVDVQVLPQNGLSPQIKSHIRQAFLLHIWRGWRLQ